MTEADQIRALLEENRQLRQEIDALRAQRYADRGEGIRRAASLPLRLTVAEFARLSRRCEETIRRMIRARQLGAEGPPYLIPRRELEKMGVSLADAAETFSRSAAA